MKGWTGTLQNCLRHRPFLALPKWCLKVRSHTGELRDMVTSPGGTTIRGLRVMEEQGVRIAMMNAVIASCERSKELGKKT